MSSGTGHIPVLFSEAVPWSLTYGHISSPCTGAADFPAFAPSSAWMLSVPKSAMQSARQETFRNQIDGDCNVCQQLLVPRWEEVAARGHSLPLCLGGQSFLQHAVRTAEGIAGCGGGSRRVGALGTGSGWLTGGGPPCPRCCTWTPWTTSLMRCRWSWT